MYPPRMHRPLQKVEVRDSVDLLDSFFVIDSVKIQFILFYLAKRYSFYVNNYKGCILQSNSYLLLKLVILFYTSMIN